MPNIDKRFALIDGSGTFRYPVIKTNIATGETGFALSPPGLGDRHGNATYSHDIAFVVEKVVKHGWKVRAASEEGMKNASIGLNMRAAKSYAICRSLAPCVVGAPVQPASYLA